MPEREVVLPVSAGNTMDDSPMSRILSGFSLRTLDGVRAFFGYQYLVRSNGENMSKPMGVFDVLGNFLVR